VIALNADISPEEWERELKKQGLPEHLMSVGVRRFNIRRASAAPLRDRYNIAGARLGIRYRPDGTHAEPSRVTARPFSREPDLFQQSRLSPEIIIYEAAHNKRARHFSRLPCLAPQKIESRGKLNIPAKFQKFRGRSGFSRENSKLQPKIQVFSGTLAVSPEI
jgi:hypothetical protein